MDYVFGTKKVGARECEILKTVGNRHSNLSGYVVIEREYPDRVIEDSFRVVRKYQSKRDSAGNIYDWYEIDNHYRDTDRFMPQKSDIQAQIDYIAMMADIDPEPELEV